MAANNPHYNADPKEIDDKTKAPDEIIFRPRGLTIVWGNDTRYWRLPEPKTGDEAAVAELLQVSWLEVTGSWEINPAYKYRVGLKLSLKADAFGWSGCPVYLMAKVGKKGRYKWRKINLLADLRDNEPCYILDTFNVDSNNQSTPADRTLYFGLYEVWSGKWKGGLRIENAIIKRVTQ